MCMDLGACVCPSFQGRSCVFLLRLNSGHELSEEQLKMAVLKIDKEGSGKITYEDFLVLYSPFLALCLSNICESVPFHCIPSQEWWKADDRWEGLRLEDEVKKHAGLE